MNINGLDNFTDYLITTDPASEDTPRVQEQQLQWVHDLSGSVKGLLANA